MRNFKPLRLVKDFVDFKITYYWIDSQNSQVSPNLETVNLAKDWFIQFHNATYSGVERRKSQIDRRQNQSTDSTRRRANNPGRRLTDQPISVSLDRSAEKIKAIKTSVSQSNERKKRKHFEVA